MHNAVIRISDVSHIYTSSQPIHALEQISLDITHGEIVSVVGQSGCGKTTFLKIVAGLLAPTSGHVTVAGLPAGEARAQRKFGMVFQNPVLFPWRTVRDNILLPFELQVAKLNSSDRLDDSETLARESARLVGLEGFWNAYPSQLSGGMQARVAIARALSYQPEVLLMDEPFGSLDEITRTKLNEHLLALQSRTQITMLVVTHSLREAAFLSHRVVVLTARPGRVQSIVNVPNTSDRLSWRETGEFSRFCMELRETLGE
jgi:ABC-type nitrate/sulfonate/bicarbonate transport system, ATPase component